MSGSAEVRVRMDDDRNLFSRLFSCCAAGDNHAHEMDRHFERHLSQSTTKPIEGVAPAATPAATPAAAPAVAPAAAPAQASASAQKPEGLPADDEDHKAAQRVQAIARGNQSRKSLSLSTSKAAEGAQAAMNAAPAQSQCTVENVVEQVLETARVATERMTGAIGGAVLGIASGLGLVKEEETAAVQAPAAADAVATSTSTQAPASAAEQAAPDGSTVVQYV